ncbi:MAG: NAD(P)H-binding protein [Desulfobulbus sp.]|nr:NAD(P)H-binding protein [Desulfobulbus sp.]
MNVLLTGASGFIGRNVAAVLARAGHHVRPLSRRHGADASRMLTPADWLAHLDGIDAVVNCIGIIGETRTQHFAPLHTLAPIALFRACAAKGVRRVVQVSGIGTDERAFSAYHLSKRAADDFLRALDVDWIVLRPSLVYGAGGGSAAFFMRLARLPLIPVVGDGRQPIQPVHVSDVAAAALCGLTAAGKQTIDVAGPETITFSEWLQRLREAQGLPRARLLRMPFAATLALSYLGSCLSPMMRPDNMRVLNAAATFQADTQPLTRLLGREPIPFAPQLLFADAMSRRKPS